MDKFTQSLRRLCDTYGGYKKVADVLGVNDQTLYQILSGVKLPSGNPKGVGPKLRKLLDTHFEGWSNDDHEIGHIFTTMTVEERELLYNFRSLTDKDRERYSKEISGRAGELRAHLEKYMNNFKSKQLTGKSS